MGWNHRDVSVGCEAMELASSEIPSPTSLPQVRSRDKRLGFGTSSCDLLKLVTARGLLGGSLSKSFPCVLTKLVTNGPCKATDRAPIHSGIVPPVGSLAIIAMTAYTTWLGSDSMAQRAWLCGSPGLPPLMLPQCIRFTRSGSFLARDSLHYHQAHQQPAEKPRAWKDILHQTRSCGPAQQAIRAMIGALTILLIIRHGKLRRFRNTKRRNELPTCRPICWDCTT